MNKIVTFTGYTRKDWNTKIRLVRYNEYSSEFYAIPDINTKRFGRRGEAKVKVQVTIVETGGNDVLCR